MFSESVRSCFQDDELKKIISDILGTDKPENIEQLVRN